MRSPSLALPVALSAIAHAALMLALFGVRIHWPSAPLPIEIVRTSSAPRIPVAPKVATASAPKSSAGPRLHHAPSPSPAPIVKAAPPAESLSGWAPDDAVVVVYLRMAPLRRSPYGEAAEQLLSGLPDYQTLLGDSNLSAVRDFDALFIATSDPTDVRATFLLAGFADSGRIAPLLLHPLDPGDPREIHLLRPGLAGLGPEAVWRPVDDGGVPAPADGKNKIAPEVAERWATAFAAVDEHSDENAGLYLTIAGAKRMVRLPNGLPTPDEADAVLTPERSPALRLRMRFSDEPEATAFAAAWPALLDSWHSAVGLVGLAPLLDPLVLTRHGRDLEWTGRLDPGQMMLALTYAKLLLPRPPLERKAAPTPPPATEKTP